MENLKALTRGTQLLLASAALLFVDMFLDWQQKCISAGPISICGGQNGWHGFWGVVLGLLTIAIFLWAVAQVLKLQIPVELPEKTVTVALGGAILVFAVLKNLIDDYSHWPSYVGVVLAAGVAAGAWLRMQEPAMAPAAAAPSAPPPAAPEPPPAAYEPPAAPDEPPTSPDEPPSQTADEPR